MTVTRSILSALFLLVPLVAFATERYAISYGGISGYQAPVWAAADLRLFEKYGLDTDLVLVLGAARGMQALISGSTHFHQGDATAAINTRLQGSDLVIVAGLLNRFPFSMVVQKSIRHPADLAGKKIGIVNFGGSNELAVISALREWNISRQSITLLPSGGASSRLVALSTGAIDATVLAPPETTKAKQMGFSILADLSELKARFPVNVIVTRRAFLEKNRAVVKQFLKAFSESVHALVNDRRKALAVYAKRLKQQDAAVLNDSVDFFAGKFSFPPRVDSQGLENAAAVLVKNAPVARVKTLASEARDETLLDELETEGFFKKLAR
ncbi:MAG: ABC transporter substrate-binding protein [Deltaproteobacteria bacterium]|nr:ABC transporter substrate-binding protein [Deltaproteobacteria bacterium]